MKAGDFVLIQFGHNDGGPINDERRARGSLPRLGDESQEIANLRARRIRLPGRAFVRSP
jgi:hypothetical protein